MSRAKRLVSLTKRIVSHLKPRHNAAANRTKMASQIRAIRNRHKSPGLGSLIKELKR